MTHITKLHLPWLHSHSLILLQCSFFPHAGSHDVTSSSDPSSALPTLGFITESSDPSSALPTLGFTTDSVLVSVAGSGVFSSTTKMQNGGISNETLSLEKMEW